MPIKMNYLNVYKFFGERHSSGVPRSADEETGDMNFHRCHLVEDYLAVHQLPDDMKKHIGAGVGVRQALGILSAFYREKRILIPSDVYPVYKDILTESGVEPYIEYPTLTVSNPYKFLDDSDGDVLLVCDPLKPLGVDMKYHLNHIKSWLDADKERVVIVDAVYDTSLNLKENHFIKLMNDGYNVILLHSLSKSWCLPTCFGITIVSPSIDGKDEIIASFRELERNVENLKKAYIALNKQPDIPRKIRAETVSLAIMAGHKLGVLLPVNNNNPSYLFKVNKSIHRLKGEGVIAINPSLYTRIDKNYDYSIVSVLDEGILARSLNG